MKNVSAFQIIIIAIFIFIAIVGVAIFAGFGGLDKAGTPNAVIWGTVPAGTINELVRNINLASTVIEVTYVEKNKDTFEDEFVNAVAEGSGPDAVLLTDDILYSQKNKLQPIPFNIITERNYLNTFVDASNIFISSKGILGVPLAIDPMVMYYNKNIFSAAGVASVPRYWDDLSTIGPSLIKRTDTSNITQAMLPFGEYENVNNAKEILATLLFQAGNPITVRNKTNDTVFSVLDSAGSTIASPAEAIIDFYTSFADPSKELYTWNRSLPKSRDAFLSGVLAIYFGYSSELGKLQDKNPNLNFDVASMPQDKDGKVATYGKITAFSIVKNTKNFGGALSVITKLTSKDSIKVWQSLTNMPSVRRDLISEATSDPYMDIFNKSAVQSLSWYDPHSTKSDKVFKDMIESITSGRKKMTDAVSDARIQLDKILKN